MLEGGFDTSTILENGGVPKEYIYEHIHFYLLQPSSWRAVGKVEGWKKMCSACHNGWHFSNPVLDKNSTGNAPRYKPSETGCDHATTACPDISEGWEYKMDGLMPALREGKTPDEYLGTLFK